MGTRIALIIVAALLALPLAQIASPLEAKPRSRTVTRTFANGASISIPLSGDEPVSASLYPSPITVSGLRGPIRDVNLRLNNLSHVYADEAQVLLVGPRGQTATVMAGIGQSEEVDGVTLRLDDEATDRLNDGLRSGAFRPLNGTGGVIAFNAPAPTVARANAALAVFDGSNPNGTWRLFVQNEFGGYEPGAFAGGWELEITAETKAKAKKRKR